MTLSATMRRMHEAEIEAQRPGPIDHVNKRLAGLQGIRSTFRDWVAERIHLPGELAELALAHKISSTVEANYRRGDMIDKRRRMMANWADFLAVVKEAGNVVRLELEYTGIHPTVSPSIDFVGGNLNPENPSLTASLPSCCTNG